MSLTKKSPSRLWTTLWSWTCVLRPRFPLFGGWKTHYVIEYLFYRGDNHVLNMRLIDHIYDDMLVEEAEVSSHLKHL